MSVVNNSKYGYFISHKTLINELYNKVEPDKQSFQLKAELFNITAPFKTSKTRKSKEKKENHNLEDPFENEVRHVENMYKRFYSENKDLFPKPEFEVMETNAVNTATEIYDKSGKALVTDIFGANPNGPICKNINNSPFLFPKNCKFYSKDVKHMAEHLGSNKYDLILLDPPWWNKYIRRKRKHTEHGYDMMYNEDLKKLPLESHLTEDGLVVVWCTNSNQHLSALLDKIFPKWGVEYLGKWYWVKVTTAGMPICEFADPPRKQPFEQIIFGCKKSRTLTNPPCDKILVSVPSALHSHKPPLIELLEAFLPDNPNCLEIFARYLLPNWTSYGKEVLRFQHESLYETKQ